MKSYVILGFYIYDSLTFRKTASTIYQMEIHYEYPKIEIQIEYKYIWPFWSKIHLYIRTYFETIEDMEIQA